MKQSLAHEAKPFVKWAGGKRQLLETLREYIPPSFGAYHEPFLGGGALLFDIMSKLPAGTCHASDLNSDLVLTYTAVRNHTEKLIEALHQHQHNFREDSKRYYYTVRAQTPRGHVEKAARLIFLNRTCFNGLYRVNSQGRFNVPIGSYVNPKIVDEVNLMAAGRAMREAQVDFECRDFASVTSRAKEGDLIYMDPPYHPISRKGNFTSYTNVDFSYKDLERLADTCQKLHEMGCSVLLSNSCASEVVQLFDHHPWVPNVVNASRNINSDGRGRKGHHELLVSNYNQLTQQLKIA